MWVLLLSSLLQSIKSLIRRWECCQIDYSMNDSLKKYLSSQSQLSTNSQQRQTWDTFHILHYKLIQILQLNTHINEKPYLFPCRSLLLPSPSHSVCEDWLYWMKFLRKVDDAIGKSNRSYEESLWCYSWQHEEPWEAISYSIVERSYLVLFHRSTELGIAHLLD